MLLFVFSKKIFEGYLGGDDFHDGLHVIALGGNEVGAGIGYLEVAGIADAVFVADVVEHTLGDG
jgi:hypothetical protein